MIQIIHGKKGTGKTKRILDLANRAIADQKGDIVFIDDDNRYMFDLRHEVRFVNAGEYGMVSPEMFLGFLSGMIAQNFDVSQVYIDAFLKLIKTDIKKTEWFFTRLEELSDKHNISFVLSISGDDEDMPAYLQKFYI
jgi:hypothetical protein